MYMIDLYDDERQRELVQIMNGVTIIYSICIIILIYVCIFPII
jgi:hypothetical protein